MVACKPTWLPLCDDSGGAATGCCKWHGPGQEEGFSRGDSVGGGGCAEKRHSTQLFKLHGTQLGWFGLGFRVLRSVWFF